ncbi:MAG: hypothetical protein AAGJ80_19215, partial [Cyanobacteria bacterium J06553_1]
MSHTGNKAAVEVQHTQESLQGLQVIWLLKIRNGRHVLVEGRDAGGVDPVAEEINRGGEENTFVRVQAQPSRPKAMEDFPEMLLVRPLIRAENQNIININEDKWNTSKQTITQPLESRHRIANAKWQRKKLITTKGGYNGGFWYCIISEWYLIIGFAHIQGRKTSHSIQFVLKISK